MKALKLLLIALLVLAAFAGGYLVAWTAFSAVAALAQRAFTAADLLSPMMEARTPLVSGAMLIRASQTNPAVTVLKR